MGIIASVIFAIILLSVGSDVSVVAGVIVLIAGPIIFWVSSFLMYGFGELIDKTAAIEGILSGRQSVSGGNRPAQPTVDAKKLEQDRKEQLEQLRSQGLISEEEYKYALSK